MAIKKPKKRSPIIVFLLIMIIAAGYLGYYSWTHWPRNEAIQTVKEFYDDEQGGDFGSAWNLLHPEVKKKFTQADYIQKRTTLFLDDYHAKGFTYKIDDVEHLKKWRMNGDSPYLKDVYKITVIQSFIGVFGETKLYKNVYVTKYQDEWKILWKY
ncbi:MAG: hypothetical protein ACO1OC_10885 [Tuberibacillus sp.]